MAKDDTGPDGKDEPFIRYQNAMYRLISMGGAALIAVLGITGIAIGRTLDPAPPAQFFFVDGILAILLFGWYLLGMRCRLDLGETWVHVATKYADFRIDRDRIDSIEADTSMWGALQWSGRPLLIRYRPEGSDKVRTRKAFGCLPNDAQGQQAVVEELQRQLGRPTETGPVRVEDDGTTVDLQQAVAERLATMTPEGAGRDGTEVGGTEGDPSEEIDAEAHAVESAGADLQDDPTADPA